MAAALALACCAEVQVAMPMAHAHPPPILSGAEEKAHAEEIKAWRAEFAKIAKSRDAKRLRALYTPSFSHTLTTGSLVDATARVKAIQSGEAVIELAPAENLVVRVPGGWTAVVTGRSRLRSAKDGAIRTVAWTAVYVRAGKGWQLAGAQENQIEP